MEPLIISNENELNVKSFSISDILYNFTKLKELVAEVIFNIGKAIEIEL